MLRFGHAGDLLRLEQPTHAAEVHLQDRGGVGAQHPREVVFRGQPLARRDGDAGGARDQGHLLGGIGRHRLLEPQGIVRLEALGEPDGAGGGHLAVRAEQQVGLVADGLADEPHETLAAVEFRERELPAIEGRVGTRRIELDRREALLHILDGPLRRALGVVVDRVGLGGRRVDVGVGADALVDEASEQLVDRLPRRLADDVPAGHLERAQHAHQREVGVLRETARIHAAPHRLDGVRVLTLHVTPEDILQQARHEIGVERHAVGLADPRDAVVRGELHEHEIASAERRRRVADHEGLDIFEDHVRSAAVRRRSSR